MKISALLQFKRSTSTMQTITKKKKLDPNMVHTLLSVHRGQLPVNLMSNELDLLWKGTVNT